MDVERVASFGPVEPDPQHGVFPPEIEAGCVECVEIDGHGAFLCQRFTYPPSMTMLRPDTQLAWSEHSHTTASATCGGWPSLPPGISRWTAAASLGLESKNCCVRGVSTIPGHTALQRMFLLLYSSATDLVRPSTPCL